MSGASPASKWIPADQSTLPAHSYSHLPVRRLITPRRVDLAVKFRFFKHLHHGGDPEAERVYRWHIEQRSGHRFQSGLATDLWKLKLADYVAGAEALLWSMKAFGFLGHHAVPVDPDGELLNGSHRVACALALGIDSITVEHKAEYVWAPAWDMRWFADHGMEDADLERLSQDWAAISK